MLPLIIGGIGAAIAGISAHAIKTSLGFYYYIKNNQGQYYVGIVEKKWLFIKWHTHQWVSHYDNAKAFIVDDDADEYARENKFRGIEIVKEVQNHLTAHGW